MNKYLKISFILGVLYNLYSFFVMDIAYTNSTLDFWTAIIVIFFVMLGLYMLFIYIVLSFSHFMLFGKNKPLKISLVIGLLFVLLNVESIPNIAFVPVFIFMWGVCSASAYIGLVIFGLFFREPKKEEEEVTKENEKPIF